MIRYLLVNVKAPNFYTLTINRFLGGIAAVGNALLTESQTF